MPRHSAPPPAAAADRGRAVQLWLDPETLAMLDALGAAAVARSGANPSRQRSPVVRHLVREAYRAAAARVDAGGRQ